MLSGCLSTTKIEEHTHTSSGYSNTVPINLTRMFNDNLNTWAINKYTNMLGDVDLFIRSNITSTKLNKYVIKNQIEAFFVEIRIRNSIWLLCCSYNPNKL